MGNLCATHDNRELLMSDDFIQRPLRFRGENMEVRESGYMPDSILNPQDSPYGKTLEFEQDNRELQLEQNIEDFKTGNQNKEEEKEHFEETHLVQPEMPVANQNLYLEPH